jgi:hypothetical protein
MANVERSTIGADGISVPALVQRGVTDAAQRQQVLRFGSQTRRGSQFAAVMDVHFARAEPDQAGVAPRTAIVAIVQSLTAGNRPFGCVIETHAARYTRRRQVSATTCGKRLELLPTFRFFGIMRCNFLWCRQWHPLRQRGFDLDAIFRRDAVA